MKPTKIITGSSLPMFNNLQLGQIRRVAKRTTGVTVCGDDFEAQSKRRRRPTNSVNSPYSSVSIGWCSTNRVSPLIHSQDDAGNSRIASKKRRRRRKHNTIPI
jgi:hypothetical protein